jgi:hypothetical protein
MAMQHHRQPEAEPHRLGLLTSAGILVHLWVAARLLITRELTKDRVSHWKNGRSGEIRTHDPQHPMLMRYQAALRSGRTSWQGASG